MPNTTDLVPMILTNALSGNITNIVLRAKRNGFIEKAKFNMAKEQVNNAIIKLKESNAEELTIQSLEHLASIQECIDKLESQGKLHDRSLEIAMDRLEFFAKKLNSSEKEIENELD